MLGVDDDRIDRAAGATNGGESFLMMLSGALRHGVVINTKKKKRKLFLRLLPFLLPLPLLCWATCGWCYISRR